MPSGSAKILLKARPTPEQLADRLKEPVPEGLEFYLDPVDISGEGWLNRLASHVEAARPKGPFDLVVEGPLRSLDGAFFDVSRPTPANEEVLRRITAFGARVGAKAAVIHLIAPSDSCAFTSRLHDGVLERALPLVRLYAALCRGAGLIPTLENIPPVAQMREGKFMHSAIGMAPEDFLRIRQIVPDIQVTLDASHAQLYINAVNFSEKEIPVDLSSLIEYVQARADVSTLDEFIDRLDGCIAEAHISNAQGLFGEGLPYAEGDLDLDEVVRRLAPQVSYLVTEVVEPDPNRSVYLREAQARMRIALEGAKT